MPKDAKPGPSTSHAPESTFLSLLSGWVQQGIESFFATQRILLDLAMRQNSSAMKILREQLGDPRFSPMNILTDLAGEATANFVDAQRVLLDLAQGENEIVMGGIKERVGGIRPAGAVADMVRRGIDNFLEMQQDYLTLVSKQAQSWLLPGGNLFDTGEMVGFAREAMANFVKAQKKFLDVLAEETANATGHSKEYSKPGKPTELYELARSASEAFYDAQKKLLDLASQQMNANLKTVSKTMGMMTPARLAPLADLTNDGVKTFVAAEKALIDSLVKPKETHRPAPAPKAEKKAKRPARTRAAKAASASSQA